MADLETRIYIIKFHGENEDLPHLPGKIDYEMNTQDKGLSEAAHARIAVLYELSERREAELRETAPDSLPARYQQRDLRIPMLQAAGMAAFGIDRPIRMGPDDNLLISAEQIVEDVREVVQIGRDSIPVGVIARREASILETSYIPLRLIRTQEEPSDVVAPSDIIGLGFWDQAALRRKERVFILHSGLVIRKGGIPNTVAQELQPAERRRA